MDLILKSLIPLTFVIALGWFAGWKKIIDHKQSSNLATLVMTFAFPCLLFIKTATSDIDSLINYKFIGSFTVGLMGMYLLVFLLNRFLYKRTVTESCQAAFVCSFPDMAFMGIPIFLVIFGETSLIAVVVGNIVTSFIMIPLTVSILELAQPREMKTDLHKLIINVFKKPLVLAPILGMIVSAMDVKMPALLMDSLKLIGNTTSGVSLFALGLIMSADKVSLNKYVWLNIFKKNIIHPLLMLLIVYLIDLQGDWAKEAILLCAMPPAIMTTMFAVKYDVLTLESSSSTVLGTVISLLTLAGFMMFLGVGK